MTLETYNKIQEIVKKSKEEIKSLLIGEEYVNISASVFDIKIESLLFTEKQSDRRYLPDGLKYLVVRSSDVTLFSENFKD